MFFQIVKLHEIVEISCSFTSSWTKSKTKSINFILNMDQGYSDLGAVRPLRSLHGMD